MATRLLLIGLLASVLFLDAGVASLSQQPGTVTVQPRMASTPQGVPEVTVSSDRNSVPVGSEVTFTLSPARIVSDPRYRVTLFFGDGKRQIMRQATISYVYPQSGTYTYFVLVEAETQSTPTPLPPLPGVKLTVSANSIEVNRPVDFSAQLSGRLQNLKYRFVFGDGSDTGWQDDPTATHSYRTANTFRAYVDVGYFSNGLVKQVGGSERAVVKVMESPRQASATVKLTATSNSIESGKPVRFTARVSPESLTVLYRFDFGDESLTAWQANSSATHRYKAAGMYSAHVELRISNPTNGPDTLNASTNVHVRKAGRPTIDLEIIPAGVPLGVPVLFKAIPTVASANAVYRFNFGDDSAPTSWSSDSIQGHIYSAAGSYAAFVEMAISGSKPVASGKRRVGVMEISPGANTNDNRNSIPSLTPMLNTNNSGNSSTNSNVAGNANNSNWNPGVTGNRNLNPQVNSNLNSPANINSNFNANANRDGNGNADGGSSGGVTNANTNVSPAASQNPQGAKNVASIEWWKYLIIAAIILFAAYQTYSYFFAPRPTFVPHFAPGNSRVASGKRCSIGLQLDIDPNIRDGAVRIDTQGRGLLKSKRIES